MGKRGDKRTFPVIVFWDKETGMYVGYVPDLPGAHTCAKTRDTLIRNLKEVLELLREEGLLKYEANFVGTYLIEI